MSRFWFKWDYYFKAKLLIVRDNVKGSITVPSAIFDQCFWKNTIKRVEDVGWS